MRRVDDERRIQARERALIVAAGQQPRRPGHVFGDGGRGGLTALELGLALLGLEAKQAQNFEIPLGAFERFKALERALELEQIDVAPDPVAFDRNLPVPLLACRRFTALTFQGHLCLERIECLGDRRVSRLEAAQEVDGIVVAVLRKVRVRL